MNHLDAQVCEVVVILDPRSAERMEESIEKLKRAGMAIDDVNRDEGVVEGTIDAGKLGDLEKLDCVDYVRKVFTYYADYPTGDPRDMDAAQE